MKTLFLAWQAAHPGPQGRAGSRAWYPIGRLDFLPEERLYRFAYTQGVERAGREAGFAALDAFPTLDRLYEDSEMFPLFQNPYALCAVAFLLGLGVGCGQPMSMSLIYALAPAGRASEAAGLRVTVNNFTHFVIPLIFGSLGTAFGFAPVWLSNAALLGVGGWLVRRARG